VSSARRAAIATWTIRRLCRDIPDDAADDIEAFLRDEYAEAEREKIEMMKSRDRAKTMAARVLEQISNPDFSRRTKAHQGNILTELLQKEVMAAYGDAVAYVIERHFELQKKILTNALYQFAELNKKISDDVIEDWQLTATFEDECEDDAA
jgi:hypothetical protein